MRAVIARDRMPEIVRSIADRLLGLLSVVAMRGEAPISQCRRESIPVDRLQRRDPDHHLAAARVGRKVDGFGVLMAGRSTIVT